MNHHTASIVAVCRHIFGLDTYIVWYDLLYLYDAVIYHSTIQWLHIFYKQVKMHWT